MYCLPVLEWRRKWQPTPVFLPGESHGQRSLVGYSPWGRGESDTTERLTPWFWRQKAGCWQGCALCSGSRGKAFLHLCVWWLQASLGLWLPRSYLQGQNFPSLFSVFAGPSPLSGPSGLLLIRKRTCDCTEGALLIQDCLPPPDA